jgi:hypothetical protein
MPAFYLCGATGKRDCTFLHVIDVFDIGLQSLVKFPLSVFSKNSRSFYMHGAWKTN